MKKMYLTGATALTLILTGCGGGDKPDSKNSEAGKPAPVAAEQTEIRIVGSSTVYPFSTKVAQEYKNKTGQNVVVESTGSGGGHKLFCEGKGPSTPDITNSSRRQKKSEFDLCGEKGVSDIIEVKIGFDGIVLANALDATPLNLTSKQIFQAFAKQVPMSDSDCTLQDNPYKTWADIDTSLPATTIEAYGPPPTSGTRDAFVEIAMEGGAKQFACLADLRNADKNSFKDVSHTIREDGKWIDSGENDNAIVGTLVNTPSALGIFGFSFLDQNADQIKGANVDDIEPTFENIAAGDYAISRSLFFYIKKDHVATKQGIQDFALEFTSEESWGPGGYLEEIGLVSLPDAERASYRAAVENLTGYHQ
ncbi:MAG: phosphate ABC transporter substrate-binding protein [Hellea sp.]|nr:phosphate ABC transporter substrate-binding protein [Hellea sp.]